MVGLSVIADRDRVRAVLAVRVSRPTAPFGRNTALGVLFASIHTGVESSVSRKLLAGAPTLPSSAHEPGQPPSGVTGERASSEVNAVSAAAFTLTPTQPCTSDGGSVPKSTGATKRPSVTTTPNTVTGPATIEPPSRCE